MVSKSCQYLNHTPRYRAPTSVGMWCPHLCVPSYFRTCAVAPTLSMWAHTWHLKTLKCGLLRYNIHIWCKKYLQCVSKDEWVQCSGLISIYMGNNPFIFQWFTRSVALYQKVVDVVNFFRTATGLIWYHVTGPSIWLGISLSRCENCVFMQNWILNRKIKICV